MATPNQPQSIRTLLQPTADHAQRAGQTPPAQSAYRDNFGKFVRQGATYTHLIRFPTSSKTTLIGYSRPRGGREKDDKVVLLQDIVRRLLASPKAYLQPGGCIEFYNNISDDDRDSVWLFTLHHSRAEPSHYASQLPWLMTYLGDLYKPPADAYVQGLFTPAPKEQPAYRPPAGLTPANPVRVGDKPGNLPPQPTHSVPQSGELSATMRFKDRLDLDDYLAPFIREGIIPTGEIEAYRWKVIRNQHLPECYSRR